jgi:hypothetical protein
MIGAKGFHLLSRLINEQTLPGIMRRMLAAEWKQWAKEMPSWMQEEVEEAFWVFMDQKLKDSLKVAAADNVGSEFNQEAKWLEIEGLWKPPLRPRRTYQDSTSKCGGLVSLTPKKCRFEETLRCTRMSPGNLVAP